MSRPTGRTRKGRVVVVGGLGALIALAIAYLRCGAGFGLGGAGGAGEVAEATDAAAPSDGTEISDATEGKPDAEVMRCQLRLGPEGLTLGGEASELEAAVAACSEAGVADLVITGDANFGEAEEVRTALKEAGVTVFEK